MYDENGAAAVQDGQTQRSGFGERSLAKSAETASTALAEQAKASVQARYIVAMQRKRDLMVTRSQLLADCKRPAFAETAIYNKPIGDGVEGPSIRLAEAAARAMGNIIADVAVIYDDAEKRIVRVSAMDLESNVTFPMDVTIAKTIERNKPQPGRRIIAQRKNSRGYDVFVIEATDEEILDKERAAASKALRTCLLRLIPGDILDEAIAQCYSTREGVIRKSPTEAIKKMVDAFESIGVSVAQLSEYLGHAIDASTPDEIGKMRSLYHAIRDKEATWAQAMDSRRSGGSEQAETPRTAADALAKKAGDVRAQATKPVEVLPPEPRAS